MDKVNDVSSDSTSQEIPDTEVPARRNFWRSLGDFFLRRREASIFVIAVVILIYFQISNSSFFSLQSVQTLAEYAVETTIIAVGEVMLLICGEIDLSVGFTYAIAPFIMLNIYNAGVPLIVAIIATLVVCALIGMANGLVTVLFKVPSFITTLGTYYVLNGLVVIISNAFPVPSPKEGILNEVLGHNIYWESFWAILFVIVMQIVLSGTRWGLHTVATGSNAHGASEVGVNVNWIKVGNFMLAAALAGFAGILGSFRVTSIDPSAGGSDIMFAAVSGAVIGGTALQGGSGTIIGAFLGTLVISILKEGITFIGVSAFTFNVILGIAILVAMIVNVRIQQLRKVGRQ